MSEPRRPSWGGFQVEAEISLDYLVATVFQTSPDDLVACFADRLGLVPETVSPYGRYPGYTSAVGLFIGAERQVTVMAGRAVNPLVIAPGFVANGVNVELQRFDFQCSRKDVAVDIRDEDAFEVVAKFANNKATEWGVRSSLAGDWMTPGAPAGRTLYLGGRKSPYFIRIYEHSKLHVGSDVNCRFEVEVKPEKSPGKMQLARLTAAEILGLRKFSVEVLAEFGVDAHHCRHAYARRQLTDLELRTLHLAQQYGATVKELLEFHAGDSVAVVAAVLEAEASLLDRKRKSRLAAARPQAVPLICL